MIKNISNLGDAALYCDFGIEVNKKINSEVIKYFKAIKEKNIIGINNLTPSYNKLIISYDLQLTNFKEIKQKIETLNINEAEKINLSRDKIFENFFNTEYFCYMTGFIAGMPFLGDLDENMRVQRLETPRVKVPKGSVGITEQFANIYTFESPGGWNILGNTPLEVFDSSKEKEPNFINPGDTVTFKKITLDQYKSFNE